MTSRPRAPLKNGRCSYAQAEHLVSAAPPVRLSIECHRIGQEAWQESDPITVHSAKACRFNLAQRGAPPGFHAKDGVGMWRPPGFPQPAKGLLPWAEASRNAALADGLALVAPEAALSQAGRGGEPIPLRRL